MQSGERIVIKGREYRLDSVLSTGAGSYGQVWAATDPAGRAVALKFINAEAMSQADPSLHGHWRAHLEREINFLDRSNAAQSRHVVALLDHDLVDGQPVLVLERLEANLGQWLSRLRRDGAPPPDLTRILDWAEQILGGLDAIHRAGFVYRDLKFSNILVGDGGALLKLADFGSLKREDGDSTLSFIGTPATMAPEQILPIRQGADGCEYAVDFRADYYALGLLLFTLLTEQSTTAAQRRLGQLLALHGQEGAGKHRDELGELTEEERDLLRRSIEFWTVPVRPEQERCGAASLLTDLLARLLARDPAARPASSAEIRAILDTMRADQPVAPSISSDGLAPPDTPPNRHLRRANSSTRPPWSNRVVGLIGVAGLIGALAWATVIQPVFLRDPVEPPIADLAPSPRLNSDARPAPAPESTTTANSTPMMAATPTQSDPPSPAEPTENENAVVGVSETPTAESDLESTAMAGASTEPSTITATEPSADPMAPTPITPPAESAVETPASTTPASELVTAESGAESTPDAPALTVAPSAANPVAPPPEPPPSTAAVTRQKTVAPAVGRSAPVPTPTKSTGTRTAKAAAAAVEKSVRTPPFEVAEPVPVPQPVTPNPRKAPSSAKSAPKSAEPTAPVVVRRHSLSAKKPLSRTSKATVPISRARPVAKAAIPRGTGPETTRSGPRSPALPPIELVSNTDSARTTPPPTQRPIELVSRAVTAKDTPPQARQRIELIGRSNPFPATVPARPTPPPPSSTIAVIPNRNPSAPPPKPPARPADPITAFQKDAGRAANDIRREAENIGNWAGRTSVSVGKEIQRGLDSANRAVSGWTESCTRANGCRRSHRVERRDRWSNSGQGTVSRSRPPTLYDDEGRGDPPSRRVQEYR